MENLSRRGVLRFLDAAFESRVEHESTSLVRTFVDLLLSNVNKLSCPNIYKYCTSKVGHHLFSVNKWNWDQIQMFERLLKSPTFHHVDLLSDNEISPLLLKNCSDRLSSDARDFLKANL